MTYTPPSSIQNSSHLPGEACNDARNELLSIFRDHAQHTRISESPQPLKRRRVAQTPINPTIRSHVSRLVCISAPEGAQRLSFLKQCVRQRRLSASKLPHLIFAHDDAEFMPPLCVIVAFLTADFLQRADIPEKLILQRIEYEMNSPEICLCRAGANGVKAWLSYITQNNHNQSHDSLLHAHASVLFPNVSQTLGAIHLRPRLHLAEKIISFLNEQYQQHDEPRDLLHQWAKKAALPSTYSTETEQRRKKDSLWTPELSGLATGRCAAEYLKEGQLYETVLRRLFAAIDPKDAFNIYLQCLNTLLQATSQKESNIYVTGSWARIVILGQRITDDQSFSDVDQDLVKNTVSSISASLGALCPTTDPYITTVLICLSRRLLIPYPSFNEEKGQLKKFRDFREWFRQFISRHGKQVVEALIQPLSQLVSLEPLELLRLNHRVFSVRRDLARVVSDYLINARTRISDLDPASTNFMSEEEAANAKVTDQDLKYSPKLIVSSARFITDFAATRQLPGALLRQINFHRYHFQKSTKVAFLSPMLFEYVVETGDPYFVPWRTSFVGHQIKLIKELAFKRRDKAISVSEANEAIKAIQDARNTRRRSEEREKNMKNDGRHVDTDSRFEDTIDAVLEMPLKQIQMARNTTRGENSTQLPLQVLKQKVKLALSESDHHDRVKLVSEMLQGFCSALSRRTPNDIQTRHKTEHTRIPLLAQTYEKWWSSTGSVLRYVLVEVLGDPSVQPLQRLFQYQLFALICGKTAFVHLPVVGAIASLIVVILTLHTDPSLADLCFTFTNSPTKMSHLMNMIIACLPFNSGCRVRNSIKFILQCVLLLHAAGETAFETILNSNQEADSTESQRNLRNMHSICKARLRYLLGFLRWALCNPWRLMEERIDMTAGISANACGYASSAILNQVATVILLLDPQEIGLLNIKQFLSIEIRCGWGHEEAVHAFLEKLECAGESHRTVMDDVLHFLATDENVLKMPHEWIQNAIVRFARDRAWCQRHMNGTSSRPTPVLAQLVQKLRTCDIQRGRKIFDFLILTDQCLFHGLSTSDAMRYVVRELNPKFWPFPRRYVRFIVRKLGAKCIKPPNLNYGSTHSQLFASNIAAEYLDDSRRGVLDGLSTDIAETLNSSLVREVNEVAEVLQILEQEYEESSDIIDGPKRNIFVSLVETHACSIGSTLILGLCKDDAVNRRQVRIQRLKHHTALLCSAVSPVIACEVIDTALSTAAVLPFCSSFSTRKSHKLKLFQTTEWMKALLCERVELIDSPDSVSAYLGVEHEHRPKDRDLIMGPIGQWLGTIGTELHDHSPGTRLPIAVCIGRILGTFRFVHDEIITRAVKRIGRNKTKALVANALRTYVSLLPHSEHLDERLPTECIERLVESRLQVQSDLLHSVVQISQALRAIDRKGFEDLLATMLHRFHDIRDEINSFFQLRKIVC